jgi:hypothetical protein
MALLGSDTSVTGPFPKGVLLLETLSGTEELGAPYVYELGLLSKEHNLDVKAVLGEPMAVAIKLGTGDWRYFHGVVTSFSKSGNTRLHTRYAATLCPKPTRLPRSSPPSIGYAPANGKPYPCVPSNSDFLGRPDVRVVVWLIFAAGRWGTTRDLGRHARC